MPLEKPGIVIDNGSYCIKAGFSCDNHPVSIFRTVVGRPKDRQGFYGKVPYEVYIGDEAVLKSDDYEVHSPVVRGKIVHWDNMERIWHHIFYRELKVAPEDREVILALSPTSTLQEKLRCCSIFFETLNCPALSVQSQSVLALYASGFTTGLSVDLGYDATCVHPIYEGGHITFGTVETYVGGRDVCEYLRKRFEERGFNLGEYAETVIEDINKNVLVIPSITAKGAAPTKYKLPCGDVIDITEEINCISDMIFNPKKVKGENTKCISIQDAVVMATRKCDADLHDDLLSGVVPTGGLTATPGFIKRLTDELELALDKPVNVVESGETYCVSWLGGAIFAGMKDASKVWVLKKQYEEYGERIVKNKFM